jgi:hypothetical protein
MIRATGFHVVAGRRLLHAALTGSWVCLLFSLAGAQTQKPPSLPGVDELLHHNYDLAIARFTEDIRLDPSNPLSYLDRGVAYKYKGDFDDALADYNHAIGINPRLAAAYGNRGVLFEEKGDLDSALTDFNQAVQLNPQSANFFTDRGKFYFKKHDYGKALSDFDDALRLNPAFAPALKGRAAALALENGAAPPNAVPRVSTNWQSASPATSLPANAMGLPDPAPPSTDSGLPGKLTILGQELTLKDQKTAPDGSEFIAEYIAAGSTWDDDTLLFAIRFHAGDNTDPVVKATRLAETILARKSREPLVNASVFKSADGKAALVDFLLQSKDFNLDLHTGYLEHNFWRFTNSNGGMLSYQIARRIYASKSTGPEILDFIKGIGPLRTSLSKEINNPQLPVPKIAQEGSR